MKRSLDRLAKASVLACLALTLACTAQSTDSAPKEVPPELEQHVLRKLPETVENDIYLDFGGKVQLLGYDVSPKEVAPPGSTVSLTLYWQRTGSLGEGWGLFTHILDERGRQIAQHDSSGPLRVSGADGTQALGPSQWEIGKIYVDELQFEIPRARPGRAGTPLETEIITLAVGVWKDMARLDVLGGSSDKHRRGLVTNLKTGVKRERAPASTQTDD